MADDSREQPAMARAGALARTVSDLLRALEDRHGQLVESATAEFLDAMVALESRLQDTSARGHSRRAEVLADLINGAPLSHGEKELLHDLRQVRNVLVHNTDVHVGKAFARSALQRLRQIADRLDEGILTAASLMTRDVHSVQADQPLGQVQAILLRRHISQVAVIGHDGSLVGWVTHRSLLHALSRRSPGADQTPLTAAAALAHGGVVAVSPGIGLEKMAALLDDPDVQSLSVMDGPHLKGIVTRGDLLRVAL